jgi:hypothetical protein
MQVRSFGRFIPSDETITVFALPGSACPSQTSNDLIADTYHVPDMFTHKPGIAEVVVVMEEVTPEIIVLRVFHHLDCQGSILCDCTTQFPLDEKGRLIKCLKPEIIFLSYSWWKLYEPLFF